MNKKDATGQEIKLGRTYGYSVDNNGLTSTTIGIIRKFNERSVSLDVIYKQSGMYINCPTVKSNYSKTVSVKAMKLFPFHDFAQPNNVLFDKDFLKELGFLVIKDNGHYGEAHSIRPKGKIILNWNREGAICDYFGTTEPRKNSYFGIKEDGGTRRCFNGIVYTREQIELLIKLSC
jgi:hypothetical protein